MKGKEWEWEDVLTGVPSGSPSYRRGAVKSPSQPAPSPQPQKPHVVSLPWNTNQRWFHQLWNTITSSVMVELLLFSSVK